MNLIPVVDVLQEKKGPTKEAHLILFEKCNLRCSFCHQDHDSTVGLDASEIMQKGIKLVEQSDLEAPIVVNITGGELFTDDIEDWMFGYYLALGQYLLQHFKRIKIVYGTNLIYENTNRVQRILYMLKAHCDEHQSVCLATSYDPAGRFNAAQRDLFFKNLDQVSHWVETVNVVITKQNIEVFLNDREDAQVAQMCEDFDVYFDHYIPSERYEEHQPTESMIRQLYLKLGRKYPNSYPIKAWKEQRFNETTCRSTKIINKDGVVTTCWSEAGKDAVLDEGKGLAAKHAAEERFLEHYNCLSCEYYQRCGLRCFLHHSFVEGSTTECEIKLLFDEIL
ncbi:hypothetical protein D3C81_144600 [compost metagenome]